MPIYTDFSQVVNIENVQQKLFYIFLIFAQNIDCMYKLTRTHNLCFGAKIIKIGIPLHTPVSLYIKVGFKGYSIH